MVGSDDLEDELRVPLAGERDHALGAVEIRIRVRVRVGVRVKVKTSALVR